MRKGILLFAIVTVGTLAAPGISADAQSAQSQGSQTAQSSPGGVKRSPAPQQAKPDPNLDLVGSWVPIAGDTSANVTIEFGKDKMSRVTECWLTVGQAREQCDFKRMGKRLAVNGYGVPDDQNPTPENFIVLAGLHGDVMKGKVYPSKSEFKIYLHGGTTETRLQQEAQVQAAMQQQEEEAMHTWKDPATGLMWTRTDNGSEVYFGGALNFCTSLRIGGHSDWRMPTLDELQGIKLPITDSNGYHVKGTIELTGKIQWATVVTGQVVTGKVWGSMSDRSEWGYSPADWGGGPARTLCVRRPRDGIGLTK
jgi:hypothetical protein